MNKILLILITTLIALIAACAPAAVEPDAAPSPSPTALDPDDPLVQDAQAYAEDQGISLTEAVSRMNVQQALSESGLQATLMENEADTFAGLWIEHEPAYRIVVAFTKNGEQTIQPYLDGLEFADLVEVRSHRFTYAQLRVAQQETMQQLNELGIGASSGVDVQENRVTLTVGNPALLQEEFEQAGFELPEPVEVEAIDPDHLSTTLRGGVETYEGPDGQTIYFPMQAPTNIYLEAEVEGMLRLDDNGCLRLSGEWTDEAYLVVWHAGFSLRFTDGIEVVNDKGQVVGRVGERLRGGGGYLEDGRAPAIPGMPVPACPGPYIILGQVEPLERQAIPDINVYPFHVDDPSKAGVFLSQSRPAPEEGAISGALALEEHCLRVDGHTVLWPPDVYPNEDAEPMTIEHRVPDEEWKVVTTLGQEVTLAGSEQAPSDYRYFENKIDCPGPYWGVARVEP